MAGTGAVYWIGQDGNVYVKGQGSVNNGAPTNIGKAPSTMGIDNNANNGYGITNSYINLPGYNFAAQQIADPATANNPPANPTGSTNPPLDTAAVHNTQASIDQIPGILQAALASEAQQYANTTAGYNSQQQQNQQQYDKSSTTNQQNYDANFMDAIRAGIHGLHGLFSLLRGTGAEGGTADQQVQNIVGDTTSSDIRGGAATRDQNQAQLDSSLASFLTDLKQKRTAATDTHANNDAAINRDSATQLQDLYSKMAGFYGSANDTADANNWMAKAGALTPQIAANTKTVTSPYDTTPVVVHAPNLTAFSAPTNPAVASTPANGQVGSGIFAINPNANKKADQTQKPSLVGA
jgi:hypothetical protein